MSKDIIQKSIKCLAKAKLETTYAVARDVILDYVAELKEEIISAKESITWWNNRYTAVVKQNDKTYKELVKLQKIEQEHQKLNGELREEINFLKLNNPDANIEHFRVVGENKRKIGNLRAENKRLNNIINELEEYISRFLYMLNGIQDRDIYEKCQLDDFTQIMDKLKELKGE